MKILFADDEKSLQNLLGRELQRMGYEVTVCPDGLTAVAALAIVVIAFLTTRSNDQDEKEDQGEE